MFDSGWVTAAATVLLAILTGVYVVRIEAGYARSIQPHLQWQDPVRAIDAAGTGTAVFTVVVRSSGPGLARVTGARAVASTGTVLAIRDFRVPSSLPVDAQYTFYVDVADFVVEMLHGIDSIRIEFDYTDIENERCYQTHAVISTTPLTTGSTTSPVAFIDVDERSPKKRRVRCTPSPRGWWPPSRLWRRK